jgi:hypothetical protein
VIYVNTGTNLAVYQVRAVKGDLYQHDEYKSMKNRFSLNPGGLNTELHHSQNGKSGSSTLWNIWTGLWKHHRSYDAVPLYLAPTYNEISGDK